MFLIYHKLCRDECKDEGGKGRGFGAEAAANPRCIEGGGSAIIALTIPNIAIIYTQNDSPFPQIIVSDNGNFRASVDGENNKSASVQGIGVLKDYNPHNSAMNHLITRSRYLQDIQDEEGS